MVRIFTGIFAIAVTVLMTGPVSSEVPIPKPAKAFKGGKCVEPVDTMRRYHMDYLLHQRDETMRQGIRGKKYSLTQCTECHATVSAKVGDGKTRTLEPFCSTCHTYAAVRIDCFECHTSQPATKVGQQSKLSPSKGHETLVGDLRIYLDERSPAP